jgi:hypothetical protein
VTIVGETGVTGILSGRDMAATRLGERFRLEERISATGGLSVWKATDEVLCRPVTIHLLPRGHEVPPTVVAAVQAAARVNDSRLAMIYDTDYGSECPYIVSEWTRGTHLEDLVLSGLPSPALAVAMIADAADALAVAHEAGRPHLCLSPRGLRWDNNSGLKITGLGIDAALSGATSDDPAAADTRALAQMLYALLTGCWPGEEATALPPAPRHRGRVYTPRQVRAGVPGVLDAITCHALQLTPPGASRSVLTPAGLAVALNSVHRPSYRPFDPAEPARCAPASAQDGESRRARHARTRSGVRLRTTLLRPAA